MGSLEPRSAIRRAGYAGFKRTVAVAMGNWLASAEEPPEDALAVLREALEEEGPRVREHAAWALGRASEDDENPEGVRVEDDPLRILGEYS